MDDFYYPVWWEKWSKRNYRHKIKKLRKSRVLIRHPLARRMK